MTFKEIKAALDKLPPDQREFWRWAFEYTHDDGFVRGCGRCPRLNPFDKPHADDSVETKKRKR